MNHSPICHFYVINTFVPLSDPVPVGLWHQEHLQQYTLMPIKPWE